MTTLGAGAAAATGRASAAAPSAVTSGAELGMILPAYARAQSYRSLKESTYDRSGGNADARPIAPGATLTVFDQPGAGVITHIWFTIAADSASHLKELVLRAYWDGNEKPSIVSPVGDFFGLNLGDYVNFESAWIAVSPGKSLNAYFAMPYRKGAKLTITNEGTRRVGAFYSNIDFAAVEQLPADALYFHASARQATPCQPTPKDKNLDGKDNYVFCETQGRGQLIGVTLGVIQNADGWWGEGDEMIFVDDPALPVINGTGSEDFFCGSWDFGGRDHPEPFSHHQYGAPLIQSAERVGGRYCCYRFHGDNPVVFSRYMKHTIEHGHGNDRGDNFYSCAYWYQQRPATDLPALAPVKERRAAVKAG
jgi:hypothetical protein